MTLTDLEQQIATLVAQLETAWNAGAAAAFAACFTSDARFVTVRGDYLVGRGMIAELHKQLFDGIYRGSKNAYTLITATEVAPAVAVANARTLLTVPGGPMAGEYKAILTLVAVQRPAGWQFAALHTTLDTAPQ